MAPGEMDALVERVPYFVELRHERQRARALGDDLSASRDEVGALRGELAALTQARAGDVAAIAAAEASAARLREELTKVRAELSEARASAEEARRGAVRALHAAQSATRAANSAASAAQARVAELARDHHEQARAREVFVGLQSAVDTARGALDPALASSAHATTGASPTAPTDARGADVVARFAELVPEAEVESGLAETVRLARQLLVLRDACVDDYDSVVALDYASAGFGTEASVPYEGPRAAFVEQMRELEEELLQLVARAKVQWLEARSSEGSAREGSDSTGHGGRNVRTEASGATVERAVASLIAAPTSTQAQGVGLPDARGDLLWECYREHCELAGLQREHVPLRPLHVPLCRLLHILEGVFAHMAQRNAWAARAGAKHAGTKENSTASERTSPRTGSEVEDARGERLLPGRALFMYLEERYVVGGVVTLVAHGVLAAVARHARAHAVVRLFAGVLTGEVHEAALRHTIAWRKVLAQGSGGGHENDGNTDGINSVADFGAALAVLYAGAREDDLQDILSAFATRVANTTSTPTTALAVELLTERLLASNEVRHQKFVRILSWKTPAGRSSVGRQAFMRVALPLFPHRAPEEVASAFAEAAAGESGSLGSGAVSIDALAHVLSVMEAEMLL